MEPVSLHLNRELLPSILRIVATPVVVLDGEARIQLFNRAAERVAGYSEDELRREPVWCLLPEDEESRARAIFRELFQGERDHLDGVEVAWMTRKGERRPMAWTSALIRDDEGEPVRLVLTGVDLTELRKLKDRTRELAAEEVVREARQEALRSSEARFSGIVEMASDAIVSIDSNHQVTLFNRGAEAIFGWEASEVLGRSLDTLLPEHARERHRGHVEEFGRSEVQARRMGERQAISGRRKDGTTFPAEASIIKVDVAGDRFYTVVLRDVSERDRSRREQQFLVKIGQLLASSLDLDTTLSTLADAAVGFLADYCVIDLLEPDGKVRRIRVSARDGADPWPARVLRDVTLDRSQPHLMHHVLEAGKAQLVSPVTAEHLEHIAQGDTHLEALRRMDPGSYIAVPLKARGRMLGTLLLVASTGRRPYDRQDVELAREVGLRAGMAVDNAQLYRDAQRAVQARDDLLGVVSHDLGNPLQAVFIGLEALERTRHRDGDKETSQDYYLSAIRRSAELMQRLIHELLEVRRMEAGHLSLQRVEQPIGPLVDEALQLIDPLARVKSITLRSALDSDALPPVPVDADRVLQILSNLVGNAVKHTPNGGTVTIRAAGLANDIQISIEDTGEGIPEKHLGSVFDRFWRAERTGGKGIGLGLAIAKGIVRAHEGRIWVESEVGRGSTFHFTLPHGPSD